MLTLLLDNSMTIFKYSMNMLWHILAIFHEHSKGGFAIFYVYYMGSIAIF